MGTQYLTEEEKEKELEKKERRSKQYEEANNFLADDDMCAESSDVDDEEEEKLESKSNSKLKLNVIESLGLEDFDAMKNEFGEDVHKQLDGYDTDELKELLAELKEHKQSDNDSPAPPLKKRKVDAAN